MLMPTGGHPFLQIANFFCVGFGNTKEIMEAVYLVDPKMKCWVAQMVIS